MKNPAARYIHRATTAGEECICEYESRKKISRQYSRKNRKSNTIAANQTSIKKENMPTMKELLKINADFKLDEQVALNLTTVNCILKSVIGLLDRIVGYQQYAQKNRKLPTSKTLKL